MKSVEGSLKRLDTDYIDLYYFHRPDPATPIEETLRVLDDLVRAGKVRYIGCSNFAAWQLCEAMWTSKTRNLEPFVAVQSRYNLIDRSIERELVPCCQKYDVGIVPWQSLAAGFLTAKYQSGQQMPPGVRLRDARPQDSYILTEANYSKLARLEAFARERDHSVNELAIAWLLSHPWLISVVAGARTVEQLSLNVPAVNWRLTKEDVAQLDKIA